MTAQPHRVSAEEYAEGLIRRAVDSATVPNISEIAEKAALSVREVEAIRDRMYSGKRRAQTPRPGVVPPSSHPAGALDWRAAKGHADPRIRGLHARAEACVQAVLEALRQWDADTALRAEEARLQAQLDAVRAKLNGHHQCPDCGRGFSSGGGLSIHRARIHREGQ